MGVIQIQFNIKLWAKVKSNRTIWVSIKNILMLDIWNFIFSDLCISSSYCDLTCTLLQQEGLFCWVEYWWKYAQETVFDPSFHVYKVHDYHNLPRKFWKNLKRKFTQMSQYSLRFFNQWMNKLMPRPKYLIRNCEKSLLINQQPQKDCWQQNFIKKPVKFIMTNSHCPVLRTTLLTNTTDVTRKAIM